MRLPRPALPASPHARQGVRVSALVPARNEAQCIGGVVRDLLAQRGAGGAPLLHEVVVADNGSSDGTAAAARAAGARVVSVPQPGYGQACWHAAQASVGEILLFVDGDGAARPSQARLLLAGLAQGADMAIGVRQNVEPGAMGLSQRVGNRLACVLMRGLWGAPVLDLGPFRAIRREAFEALDMQDRSFGWTVEMQVRAQLLGLCVVHAPVDWRRRAAGVSKISGTLRGVVGAALGIFGMIARLWWREHQRASARPLRPGSTPVQAPGARPVTPSFPQARPHQPETSMIQSTFFKLGSVALLAFAAGVAFASGSDGGGSAVTGDSALYNTGKSVYATKLACAACPLAGKTLDAALAREVLAKSVKVSLSDQESAALAVYLKRRFKL
jgi:Glycosyl transferase family 2